MRVGRSDESTHEKADGHGEREHGARPVHLSNLGQQITLDGVEREEKPDDDHGDDSHWRCDPCGEAGQLGARGSSLPRGSNRVAGEDEGLQKVHLQETFCAKRPPTKGPSPEPSEMAMPSNPCAAPRSFMATTSLTMIIERLLIPPPPIPATARQQ